MWCTRTAISALAEEDKATCPSTPAVLRPALRCVTCRTLTSVFDQDRSIIFCRDRALAQSCSRVALKILCRSRLTLPSWTRQSMASQSGTSSGPFTVSVSNLPFGSAAQSASAFKGSPAHVSALSGPATRAGIRPVIPRAPGGGAGNTALGFLPPFGHRHPLLGHPVPAREFRPPHGRPTRQRLDPGGVSTFRTSESRPEWVPSLPRGPAVLTRPVRSLRPPLAPSPRGQALSPRSRIPSPGAVHYEASSRVHSRSPARPSPSPVGPLDGTRTSWACSPGFAPRQAGPARRTPGRGTGIEHSPGATRPASSPDLLSRKLPRNVRPRVARSAWT